MKTSLSINPKQESEKIVKFLKSVQRKTEINKVIIGLSGGIDSTTVYHLLQKAYKKENIIGVTLPYSFIKPIVEKIRGRSLKVLSLIGTEPKKTGLDRIRLGNIMARVRMIILFDLAKKYNALVCGTENKSEKLLGYYTRFGDAASDIEPITHLYKTQVYQLAEYLKVPKKVIDAKPTAGLWSGQTDEGEFGFTYTEADQVLYLAHDRGEDIKEIKKLGYEKAEKIIKRMQDNKFKLEVPYSITDQ